MSSDNGPTGGGPPPNHRRSSITQAAFSNLFQRGPPPASNGPSYPPGNVNDPQRRRLSVTTIGLSGTSPTNSTAFGIRRGSLSTNSDSIDENAVEDDDFPGGNPRTAPTTPFARRMSFGAPAMRGYRPSGSPGNGNIPASTPPSLARRPSAQQAPGPSVITPIPEAARRRASSTLSAAALSQASNTQHPRASSDNIPTRADQQGFNWSEQLRSRAESSVTSARPSFPLASSPPRAPPHHDRAKSVSDMPQPPAQASAVKPKPESRKPDAFQERILKGDFYMD
ncbi:hypothetical protein HIM_02489 [Hirsutella minnesotensis 3608]|nr:hypothetical protein HIM_02489 [Hirsutella minnesotensis 3608]